MTKQMASVATLACAVSSSACRRICLAAGLMAVGFTLLAPATAEPQTPPPASAPAPAGALGCDPGERIIRFSHVVVETGHPKGEAARDLAAEVNQKLDGVMCMEVFPNSTLFDDDAVLRAMLDGEVEMAAPSLSKFERYTRTFRIFDLPFLFRDLKAVEWFQNSGPGKRLKRRLDGTGLRGLAFWNAGMKQISATRPLIQPEDARGLTFRVQNSEVLKALIRQLGGEARAMPFKDVRGALERGDVQGQSNSWANIYTKEFFRFQDGVTVSNHGLLAYLVVTSDQFWKSLSASERVALNRILVGVTARANQAAQTIARRNREALEREGVVLRRLAPAQRAAWVDAMRPVWDRFAGEIGEDFIETAVSANR